MAPPILTDCVLLIGAYDLSGDSNAVTLEFNSELVDDSTFGQTTRRRRSGVLAVRFNLEGFWHKPDSVADLQDATIFSNVGGAAFETSFAYSSADEATAFLLPIVQASYTPSGSWGEMLGFAVEGESAAATDAVAAGKIADLIRGQLMIHGTFDSGDSPIGGTDCDTLGTVGVADRLFANLHVWSAAGTSPTLDVAIQSSATGAWAGEEVQRIAFTQATGATHERKSVAGSIAHTHWRGYATIGGRATPPFGFAVAAGIK